MKILIVTKNWLGDVLFQLPAIQALRDHYPQAEITCMTPERCLEVLRAHPAVDRLISFDERTTHRSLASKVRLIAELRKDIDICTDETHDAGTADLLTGILQQHESIAWILRRYLS